MVRPVFPDAVWRKKRGQEIMFIVSCHFVSPLFTTIIPAVASVWPTVLVVTDLESHPKLIIFILFEKAYAIFY